MDKKEKNSLQKIERERERRDEKPLSTTFDKTRRTSPSSLSLFSSLLFSSLLSLSSLVGGAMNERERDEELIAEQVKQLLLGGGTNNNNNKNNGDDDFESESESESAEEEATISMRDYVEGLDISTGLSSSASSVLEASKELAILIQ